MVSCGFLWIRVVYVSWDAVVHGKMLEALSYEFQEVFIEKNGASRITRPTARPLSGEASTLRMMYTIANDRTITLPDKIQR